MTKAATIEDIMISAFNALTENAINYETYKTIMCLTIPNLKYLNMKTDEYQIPLEEIDEYNETIRLYETKINA